MTDPAGGAPNQGTPVPPPAAAPAPPPAAPVPPPAAGYQAPPPQPGAPAFTQPNLQASTKEAGPAPGIAYADLVPRIIALIIDYVILFIPFLVIQVVLVAVLRDLGGIVASLALAAASAGYFVYLWTKQRATYGQKFQKLECVSAKDGATLTQDQAIRRWAFLFGPSAALSVLSSLPFLFLLTPLLGLAVLGYEIYLLWSASQSPKRQGFHDVQAGTVVVQRV